jgi:putative sigma-54 modulation protein
VVDPHHLRHRHGAGGNHIRVAGPLGPYGWAESGPVECGVAATVVAQGCRGPLWHVSLGGGIAGLSSLAEGVTITQSGSLGLGTFCVCPLGLRRVELSVRHQSYPAYQNWLIADVALATPVGGEYPTQTMEGRSLVQINISTRHGQLSAESREKLTAKLTKLSRFQERVTAVNATVDLEHPELPGVELRASVEHAGEFIAAHSSDSLLGSVDEVIRKLEQQLRRHKKKTTDRRHTGNKAQQLEVDIEPDQMQETDEA